jgi:hypothetical protein
MIKYFLSTILVAFVKSDTVCTETVLKKELSEDLADDNKLSCERMPSKAKLDEIFK